MGPFRSWLRLCFCRSNLIDFVYFENRDGTDLGYASVFVDLIIIVSKLSQHSWQLFKPVILRKRQRWDRSWLRLCFSRSNLINIVYLVLVGYAAVDVDLMIIVCIVIQHSWWQLFKPVMLRKRQRWDRSWLRLCFCRFDHNSQ